LAVTIAEMCIASELGVCVDAVDSTPSESIFADLATSYVLEMPEAEAVRSGFPTIGRVTAEPRFRMAAESGGSIDLTIGELAAAWRAPLAYGGSRK
jgi:phosphoribosylformylglycinamidine (FGAM) synthase-like enzyme